MRRKVVKNLKGASGITLIALVITIIVLLILAGVSIAMLTGDNGILKQANKAKVETRGASVQEVRDLWFIEKKLNAAKSLDEVLQGLRDQDLLTDEEVAKVKETGQVTIGSRTIVFGGGNVELVAKVMKDYEGNYYIGVGFEDYQVESDYSLKIEECIKNKTEKEKEEVFIEMVNYYNHSNYDNIDDIFRKCYENGETSKICTSLEELAKELELKSENELFYGIEYWIDNSNGEFIIEGKIIDPSGKEGIISTANISSSRVFSTYCYRYKIDKNDSYTFKYIGNDGVTSEITIIVDENNPDVISINSFDTDKFALMAGIDNYLNVSKAEIVNLNNNEERMNCTNLIENEKYLNLFLDMMHNNIARMDMEVILTYNNIEYKIKNAMRLEW